MNCTHGSVQLPTPWGADPSLTRFPFVQVALGLFLCGAIPSIRLATVFIAQIMASVAVSWLLEALLPGELQVGTTLAPSISLAQGVFIEMFLTMQLMIAILLLAVEKHKATHLAPLGIGFALFVGHLAGVYFTGASLNPARSFGPATVSGFSADHWVYWVGPITGAAVASGVWRLLRKLQYQTANPGQDFDDLEAERFVIPVHAAREVEVRRPIVGRVVTAGSVVKTDH